MAVTLFPSGVSLNDTQEARLDAFIVAVWLTQYRTAHDGDDPPGWPAAAGHIALAEWAIYENTKQDVMDWERRVARKAVSVPDWD